MTDRFNSSCAGRTPLKGKSIIDFPELYAVVDIETTGLDPLRDEIIELSAIRFEKGKRIGEFSTLVRPRRRISSFITDLTGITDEMLRDAPRIEDCIAGFEEFVGYDIILGYNVSFDVGFISTGMMRILGRPFLNPFVDVMRIARRELPELPHHRQTDIADYFSISVDRAHRALDDCETCNKCYEALKEHILSRGITLESFCSQTSRSSAGAKEKRT